MKDRGEDGLALERPSDFESQWEEELHVRMDFCIHVDTRVSRLPDNFGLIEPQIAVLNKTHNINKACDLNGTPLSFKRGSTAQRLHLEIDCPR